MKLLLHNQTIICIREVPNEVYKSLDAIGEGENWWEVWFSLFSFLFTLIYMQLSCLFIDKLAVLNCGHCIFVFSYVQAVELQKLILAHNNIESLKEDLRNLPLLTVLNVSHNKLSHLPTAIGEYAILTYLTTKLFELVFLLMASLTCTIFLFASTGFRC